MFPVYSFKKNEFIINPYSKKDKSFGLHSVDTVILSGSDYDFGYPAISNAKNVYFLGKPPEDVGQILDEDTVEKIYCSDEFEFEWTRSTVASWVRQKLTILPADQINDFVETTINNTSIPTNTPKPPYEGMSIVNTPKPTATLQSSVLPTPTAEPEKRTADPIAFVVRGRACAADCGHCGIGGEEPETEEENISQITQADTTTMQRRAPERPERHCIDKRSFIHPSAQIICALFC